MLYPGPHIQESKNEIQRGIEEENTEKEVAPAHTQQSVVYTDAFPEWDTSLTQVGRPIGINEPAALNTAVGAEPGIVDIL